MMGWVGYIGPFACFAATLDRLPLLSPRSLAFDVLTHFDLGDNYRIGVDH
jgi:hypothetical protein